MSETTIMASSEPSLANLTTYFASVHDPDVPAPWTLDGWTFATNGHLLVAHRAEPVTPDRVWDHVRKGIEKYVRPALVDPIEVAFRDLHHKAGPICAMKRITCDWCCGDGRHGDDFPCEHCHQLTRATCSHCDGDGETWNEIDKRIARIAGVPVNLALLAYGLAIVTRVERVRMARLATSDNNGALLVEPVDGSWRIALMQVAERSATEAEVWP